MGVNELISLKNSTTTGSYEFLHLNPTLSANFRYLRLPIRWPFFVGEGCTTVCATAKGNTTVVKKKSTAKKIETGLSGVAGEFCVL